MKNIAFIFVFYLGFNGVLFAQQGMIVVEEDSKIRELLNLKTALDRDNKLKDGFTIQLQYGELKEANNVINEYKRNFTDWTASIEYETPNYKVWVGNFLTRLEADRALLKIQKKFPNAFVFKPERKEKKQG